MAENASIEERLKELERRFRQIEQWVSGDHARLKEIETRLAIKSK